MLSPLATQVPRRADAITRRIPWGLLVHTTGSGVIQRARLTFKDPMQVALRIYRASQDGSNGYAWGGPSYVLGHDGELVQIADDDVMTMHAGGPHRAVYLSGNWTSRCSPEFVARWRAQWPGYASPQHLYPSSTPNRDFIGLEIIPCGLGYGAPMRPGLRFSKAQHDAVVALGRDLAARHGWPVEWARTTRLLGHEDVQPLERTDKRGRREGWDPGYLRSDPYFDFSYVRRLLDPLSDGGPKDA